MPKCKISFFSWEALTQIQLRGLLALSDVVPSNATEQITLRKVSSVPCLPFIESCFFWSVMSWYPVWTVFLNSLVFKPNFHSSFLLHSDLICSVWLWMSIKGPIHCNMKGFYLLWLNHVKLLQTCRCIVCWQECLSINTFVQSPGNETNELDLSPPCELKKQID